MNIPQIPITALPFPHNVPTPLAAIFIIFVVIAVAAILDTVVGLFMNHQITRKSKL